MKTFLKRFALCLGGLLILLALFHLIENWRGKRAWQQWKQARIAAGDSYDPARLAPPAVADSENFARAPRIAESVMPGSTGPVPPLPVWPEAAAKPGALGDWRGGQKADLSMFAASLNAKDAAELVKPWETELAALTEAAKRPHCRLANDYSKPFEAIPALLGMRARGRALSLRALVALRDGRYDAAFADILTGLRVASHLQKEPHLLSQLLRTAWVNILMQPIWESLQDHRWKSAQLAELQAAIAPVDLLASYRTACHYERLGIVADAEQWATGMAWTRLNLFGPEGKPSRAGNLLFSLWFPTGWGYQNLLRTDQHHVAQFQNSLDPERHLIHPVNSDAVLAAYKHTVWSPYTHIFRLGAPGSLAAQNIRIARTQSSLDLAVIACALERYRLDKGHYPTTLEALVPSYLPATPVDVIEGLPLKYTPGKTGFTLYSVGWNLTDEGGKMADRGADSAGDWVWSIAH